MTYYVVGSSASLLTIGQAVALAVDGDIIVVPAGDYTEDLEPAFGVTVRAVAGATVRVFGKWVLAGNHYFRGLEFRKGSNVYTIDNTASTGFTWFERCTFHPEGTFGTFTAPILGDLTFNRCLFTDEGVATPTAFLMDSAVTGGNTDSVTFTSCVFTLVNDAGDGGGFIFYDPPLLSVIACTFIIQQLGGPSISCDDSVSYLDVRYNIIVSRQGDSGGIYALSTGSELIEYNRTYGFSNITQAINYDSQAALDATNVNVASKNQANLVDLNNLVPGPRNGPTSSVNKAGPAPLVDFHGFKLDETINYGAIQLKGENSALYQPWYDMDLLAGITFKYSPDADPASGEAVVSPHASMLGEANYYSPLAIADIVNTYIQDVATPAGAVFYVDYLGNYRLRAILGNFCLTTSGDAVLVFGAASYTNVTDTGDP